MIHYPKRYSKRPSQAKYKLCDWLRDNSVLCSPTEVFVDSSNCPATTTLVVFKCSGRTITSNFGITTLIRNMKHLRLEGDELVLDLSISELNNQGARYCL